MKHRSVIAAFSCLFLFCANAIADELQKPWEGMAGHVSDEERNKLWSEWQTSNTDSECDLIEDPCHDLNVPVNKKFAKIARFFNSEIGMSANCVTRPSDGTKPKVFCAGHKCSTNMLSE